MNFDFSAEQEQLRDQARRVFAGSLAGARSLLETDVSHDHALWRSVVELGWPAAGISEDDGGLGLSALEWCVLAEEAGRTLAPIPFASSVQQATVVLQQAYGCAQSATLLGTLALGEQVAVVAFTERGQHSWLDMPSAHVLGGRLTGLKPMVADAAAADVFIVSALDEQGRPGGWQVQAQDPGVRLVAAQAIDRVRRHADVHFEQAQATPLAAGADWQIITGRALDAAAVLTAFEQLGGAEAALAMTLDYVKTRKAFGRLVGGYQAVKHALADLYVKNQLARSHCYYGAWALTHSPAQLPRAAAGARLAASDAFNTAAEASVELFGGIGFTWESDTQLFYRRARLLATQLGGRAFWAQRLVSALAREPLEESY
jgi:acyl-CoA dehydrogenase